MTARVLPFRKPAPRPSQDYATLPARRGYVVHYSPGIACPGCGRRAWYVGRLSAECANERCGCAIALGPGGVA